jgi:ELWxxDGT repeat protein
MKPYYIIAFFLLLAFSVEAQSIELVKKFSRRPNIISSYEPYNSSLFFSFDNALWKTDGDSNSTTIVKQFSYGIKNLMVWNNKLYFFADDGQSGWELWLSDGTTQGTQLIKDINPGPSSAFMTNGFDNKLTVYNNAMYFPANDGTHGRELWRTDGTAAGTFMVIDVDTTSHFPLYTLDGVQSNISVTNNQLFFDATDSKDSFRLWVSNGIASGTHPINTVMSGGAFCHYNNKLFFYGISTDSTSPNFGRDGLFSTDGTEIGTQLVYDSMADMSATYAVMNNRLYFLANKLIYGMPPFSLYVTDGTTGGTSIIKDTVFPVNTTPLGDNLLCVYDNNLYFPNGTDQNSQLWKSDGTASGTHQLTSFGYSLEPSQLIVANGLLYFKGLDTSHVELWSTDGTAANTKVVEMLGNNYSLRQSASLRSPIYQYNNYLFFGNFYINDTGALYKYQLYPDAIANVPNIAKTEVYPNPAQNFIYYKGEVHSMVAYDIEGKQVTKASSNKLDVRTLTPGSYLVLIETAKIKQFARFIKE